MELKFKGKIWKQSQTGYVVTIPKVYVDNELVKEDTEYEFEIKE